MCLKTPSALCIGLIEKNISVAVMFFIAKRVLITRYAPVTINTILISICVLVGVKPKEKVGV